MSATPATPATSATYYSNNFNTIVIQILSNNSYGLELVDLASLSMVNKTIHNNFEPIVCLNSDLDSYRLLPIRIYKNTKYYSSAYIIQHSSLKIKNIQELLSVILNSKLIKLIHKLNYTKLIKY